MLVHARNITHEQLQCYVTFILSSRLVLLGCRLFFQTSGCGQYYGQGVYCGLSTASELILIFTTQQQNIIILSLKPYPLKRCTKKYVFINLKY